MGCSSTISARPAPQTIEDKELLLDEHRLRERCGEMNAKNDQIAHFIMVSKPGIAWGCVTN